MDFRNLINTIDKLESKKTLTEVVHRKVTKEPGLKESADYTLKFKKGSIAEALLDEKSQEGNELDALRSDPNSTKLKKAFGGEADTETPAAARLPAAATTAAEPAAAQVTPAATNVNTSVASEPAPATTAVPPQTTNVIANFQRLLNKYNARLKVDGALGTKTAAAILNYRTLVSRYQDGANMVTAARGVESRYPREVAAARKAMLQPVKSTQFKGSSPAATTAAAPQKPTAGAAAKAQTGQVKSMIDSMNKIAQDTSQSSNDRQVALSTLVSQYPGNAEVQAAFARAIKLVAATPAVPAASPQSVSSQLNSKYPSPKENDRATLNGKNYVYSRVGNMLRWQQLR